MDEMMLLQTGNLLLKKANEIKQKSNSESFENRAMVLFECALNISKRDQHSLCEQKESFLFTYNMDIDSTETVAKKNDLLENAIVFLVQKYFEKNQFNTCIDLLKEIELPFATYFMAESYKKLSAQLQTPKKRAMNLTTQKDYLKQTVELLKTREFHPLKFIINKHEVQEVEIADSLPTIRQENDDCKLFLCLKLKLQRSLDNIRHLSLM